MSIVFFDLETGGTTEAHPNIQLAAIAVDSGWNEIGRFEAKIKFDPASSDPEALRINHYDASVWEKEAQPEPYVIGRFDSFLSQYKSMEMVSKRTGKPYSVARLAGHNASTFDMPRLRKMYAARFLPAHPLVLDTLQLALWYFLVSTTTPKDLKLTTIAEFFGIKLEAHDALADVRASAAIAREMIPERND